MILTWNGAIGLRRTTIWAIRSKSGIRARQEGAAAEKAVPFSVPLFDAKPLLASHRRHRTGWKMQKRNVRGRSAALAEEESSMTKGGSK